MGFFKKIKKGLSSAWKGIKKGFKKVLTKVGKFLQSGWGKALMIVAGIVTMGAALAAGAAAYSAAAAASQGFMSSLVAGGSAVLSSLTGGLVGTAAPGAASAGAGTVAGQTAGQTAKAAQGAAQAADVATLAGEAGQVATNAVGATGAGAGAGAGVGAGAGAGVNAGVNATTSSTGGLLSRAAKGIGNFAKNPIGETIKGVKNVGGKIANTFTGGGQGASGELLNTANMGAAQEAAALGLNNYSVAGGLAQPTAAQQVGGMLTKAGKGLYNYATSEGGGQMLGKVVEGYSQGRILEEQAREERKQSRRLDARWRNFDWGGEDLGVDLGAGWNARAQEVGRRPTSVNYQNQYAAGAGG